MSHLLNKSKLNKNAAFFLYTDAPESYYAASVHCSYYSCLQKIIHLKDAFSNKYSELNIAVKGGKGNSHNDYIWKIGFLIGKESSKAHADKNKDRRDIKSLLEQLKDLRLEADYYDMSIEKDKAEKAYNCSIEIHKIIKMHLKQ
jgi:hypothetical protein